MSCIVDGSRMNCNGDDLLIAIRKLKFVVRAEKASMNGKVFSNFLFPVSLMNKKNTSIIFDVIPSLGLWVCSKIEEQGRKYALRLSKR